MDVVVRRIDKRNISVGGIFVSPAEALRDGRFRELSHVEIERMFKIGVGDGQVYTLGPFRMSQASVGFASMVIGRGDRIFVEAVMTLDSLPPALRRSVITGKDAVRFGVCADHVRVKDALEVRSKFYVTQSSNELMKKEQYSVTKIVDEAWFRVDKTVRKIQLWKRTGKSMFLERTAWGLAVERLLFPSSDAEIP